MNDYNILNNYLDYRSKYFDSLSEFVKMYKFLSGKFLSIFCIRSINAHFDELLLHSNNDNSCCELDVIILTETWHNIVFYAILIFLVTECFFKVLKEAKTMV